MEHAVNYAVCFRQVQDAPRGEWEARLGDLLAEAWSAAYISATSWQPEILEIELGRLTYLFDAAPARHGAGGEDRVVGVWGWSTPPGQSRDAARMAGFVPAPHRWSGRDLDRGHFVSHAAGGGTDLNLFPQVAAINRGRGAAGRRWRVMERRIATRPGTFLFVRPIYDDGTWVPAELDLGYIDGDDLVSTRFSNRPLGARQ